MRNIKITVEYDGTNYSGWQKQKNTALTIQQRLEEVISLLNKKKVNVIGAGRTDAGVHAINQVANFKLDVPIPLARIPAALNSELPPDIICKQAEEVEEGFHACYDARGKKYRYRIINRSYSSVFVRYFVYNVRQPLDFAAIRSAARYFTGEHDFSAFMAQGSGVTSTVREIKDLTIEKKGEEYHLEVTGTGFLYKMIRIIVGTLLEVGLGKREPDRIPEIIKSGSRSGAGFTAPAKGLTLVEVYY